MDMILTCTGFYRFSKRGRWKIPIWYQHYFIRGKKLFRIRETRRHDTTYWVVTSTRHMYRIRSCPKKKVFPERFDDILK